MTLQPAAPFFGIWGIVFAGEALYVLAQAAPGWDADAMLNESGLWHAGALIATNAWGAIFQVSNDPSAAEARGGLEETQHPGDNIREEREI